MGQRLSTPKQGKQRLSTPKKGKQRLSIHNKSQKNKKKSTEQRQPLNDNSRTYKPSSSGLTDPRDHSTRETLASWVREGVVVTEVYNVHEVIGHGHLGEITMVSKKPQKLHHSNTTQSMDSSVRGQTTTNGSMSQEDTERHSNVHATSAPPSGPNNGHAVTDNGAQDHLPPSTASSSSSVKRGRLYACKTVSTIRLKAGEMEELLNEVRIMRDLDHPHILQLYEVYYVKRKIWLIVELCTGGDLYKRIDTNTELDVCLVMEQILRAVAYMHRRGVCHRDIKLENILYEHAGRDAGIKLIDFGLAQKFTRGTKMLRACGTFYSVAPEVIQGGRRSSSSNEFSEKSDLWSIGCVAFILLSGGEFPFLKGDPDDVKNEAQLERLMQAKYEFGLEWDDRGVSDKGKEFIRCCLRKQPSDRWSAKEALEFTRHEWLPELELAEEESDTPEALNHPLEIRRNRKMDSVGLKGMANFCMNSQLKKRVLMTMAYTMDKSSIGELSDLFIAMDTEGTGTISLEDMRHAIHKFYDERGQTPEFSEKDVEKLFEGIDQDHSGQIHYAEFLAAVIESQGLLTLERLGEAFDRIDSEGKGYISKENLREILGNDCDEELVTRMIEEADWKKDGQVDYDEFLTLMYEDPGAMEMIGQKTP